MEEGNTAKRAVTHKPPMRVGETPRSELYSLARAVIEQAFLDTLSIDDDIRYDAVEFLSNRSEDLEYWCSIAEVSSDAIMANIKAMDELTLKQLRSED